MIKGVGFIIYAKHHKIRGVSTTPKMDFPISEDKTCHGP